MAQREETVPAISVAEPVSEVSGTPLSALTAVEQRAARHRHSHGHHASAPRDDRRRHRGVFRRAGAVRSHRCPARATEQFSADRLQSPNWEYPFGTDEFGRDILSRILYGARISFQVGIIVVGIAGTAGVLLGMLGGFKAGSTTSSCSCPTCSSPFQPCCWRSP